MIPKRSELVGRYGLIDLKQEPQWPGSETHMINLPVPEPLQMYLLYRTPSERMVPVSRIYLNRDMAAPLNEVFRNIQARGLMAKIHEFGGCFNIRMSRGGNRLSAHAYGLAIDINQSENPLGHPPGLAEMHPELVKCFEDVGFTWGGRWERPDCMHFQWLTED